MNNGDLIVRVESANPVSVNAFRDLTDTPEGRNIVERIVAGPQPDSVKGVSTTGSLRTRIGWKREPHLFTVGPSRLR